MQSKRKRLKKQPSEFKDKIPEDLQKEIGLNFNPNDTKYKLPCIPILVRRKYVIFMSGTAICFLTSLLGLNITHFATYFSNHKLGSGPNVIFLTALAQIGVGYAFEVVVIIGVFFNRPSFIKLYHSFQGVRICASILNAGFTLSTIHGSYDEQQIFLIKQPILIEVTAYLCAAFAVIEMYLFTTSSILWKYVRDKSSYRKALAKARHRYRYKIFATILALARRNLAEIELELANEKVKCEESFEEEENKIDDSNLFNLEAVNTNENFEVKILPDESVKATTGTSDDLETLESTGNATKIQKSFKSWKQQSTIEASSLEDSDAEGREEEREGEEAESDEVHIEDQLDYGGSDENETAKIKNEGSPDTGDRQNECNKQQADILGQIANEQKDDEVSV